MAEKRYTISEVIDGLDESDYEESEDDFEGYLDMDNYDECDEEQQDIGGESGEIEEQEIEGSVGLNEERGDGDVHFRDVSQWIPEYKLQAGCSASVKEEKPYDYFSLLFTDEILEHIVDHTNLHATQYIDTHELAPHSRVCQWSKSVHDVAELRRFLAMIIVMGLVRYPQLEHHWATQWPYYNTHFSSVSYTDFAVIHQFNIWKTVEREKLVHTLIICC